MTHPKEQGEREAVQVLGYTITGGPDKIPTSFEQLDGPRTRLSTFPGDPFFSPAKQEGKK